MSIVAKTDFQGEIVIANKSDLAVADGILWFIAKYETKYLNSLLGSDFATLFTAGLIAGTDPRWAALLTPNGYDLKTAIASFIYYWYMRDQDTQTVGIGTVKSNAKNAVVVSAAEKVKRAWNEMVCISYQVLKLLKDNAVTYPEFVMPTWFNSFCLSWTTWNFSIDIFYSDIYFEFYRRQRIPDIFININTMGI